MTARVTSAGQRPCSDDDVSRPLSPESWAKVDGVARRIRTDLHTPAERAIRAAMLAVEEVGAHPWLTRAITLLAEAQQRVGDFVDTSPEWDPAEQEQGR